MSDLVPTGASLIATSPVARRALPALTDEWTESIRKRAEAVAGATSVDAYDLADDLEQAALIAFWRVTESFDPALGAFEHYAQRAIRYAMISELRKHRLPVTASRRVSLDDPKLDPAFLQDPKDSPEVGCERAEIRARIGRWVATSPPKQREVFSLVYEKGLTQGVAAKRMGVSQPRIAQLHKTLKARGKNDLTKLKPLG
jgi:RNA polymerase sigma factor (sigma-70 family)